MAPPERHTILQYEEELRGLRGALLEMGSLVERQIAQAVEALVNRDAEQARQTIAADLEVNRMDVAIDGRCIRLLALYQPMAGDLRLVTTGLRIVSDLERIGDNAANICERVLELNAEPPLRPGVDIPGMAAVAQSMVRDSLDAFTRNDPTLAEAVIARDDEVDRLNRRIFDQLLTCMTEDPHTIGRATRMLFVAKYLEKIADHAADIAEMVVFMVKGRTIRHMDKNRKSFRGSDKMETPGPN
jgi:phosphate transport system protein